MIRRIAVLSGDEDVPGMNAAIQGAARAALEHGWQVMGVCDDDSGQLDGKFIDLTARTVDGIGKWSASLLESIDSREFLTDVGKRLALRHFGDANIDALIVIGGAATQAGALALSNAGFPVNGIAASMENEIAGFDTNVGVDTGVNVALDSIDQLTMAPLTDNNVFIVEVVGRRCGYAALVSGILGGADAVAIPELEITPEQIADAIKSAYAGGTANPLIVVSEGANHNAQWLHSHFAKGGQMGYKTRETLLAHIQRRAVPSAFDRMLGMRLGAFAVEVLARGIQGVVVGPRQGEIGALPFAEVVGKTRELDEELIRLASILLIGCCTAVQAH